MTSQAQTAIDEVLDMARKLMHENTGFTGNGMTWTEAVGFAVQIRGMVSGGEEIQSFALDIKPGATGSGSGVG
jgi:hypothetical protein